MTKKKLELNIGTIVEKVTRRLNFTSHGSSETLPTEKDFKVELERMMQRQLDRKSTRLNSSHSAKSRMPSSA